MASDSFEHYSAYYDLLYHDKDYRREADYVIKTLRALNPAMRDILEFGSGTGRHGCLLADHGLTVFGIERSEAMIAAASMAMSVRCHRSAGSFQHIRGDIRNIRIDYRFDAVVSLFHVISYQTTNGDVVDTFANAAHHLKPGGFLFDVWHGPAVLTQRPSVRIKRVEDEKTRVTRIGEPELDSDANVVSVRYTFFAESKAGRQLTSFHEEHRMRYFFPVEVEFFAQQTGFHVEKSETFVTCERPSESTWGVGYLLRKESEAVLSGGRRQAA